MRAGCLPLFADVLQGLERLLEPADDFLAVSLGVGLHLEVLLAGEPVYEEEHLIFQLGGKRVVDHSGGVRRRGELTSRLRCCGTSAGSLSRPYASGRAPHGAQKGGISGSAWEQPFPPFS